MEDVDQKGKILAGAVNHWGFLGILAGKLINDSTAFIKELFNFMTEEVTHLNREQGEETEKANWQFVSHVVREIFSELHKIRQYAANGEPVLQIWYTIQAWHTVNESNRKYLIPGLQIRCKSTENTLRVSKFA